MISVVSLDGKRILITGGARGLGLAFGEAAIAAGADVAIADILEDVGQTAADQMGAAFVSLDLADPASITSAMDRVADRLGGLDGLVNCLPCWWNSPPIFRIEISVWR